MSITTKPKNPKTKRAAGGSSAVPDPDLISEAEPNNRRQRTRERDQQITELSLAGLSILDIGKQFGAATRGSATRLVERALDERLPGFDAALARRVDSARLDRLLNVWWERATAGDPLASLIVVAIIDARVQLDPEHHGGPGDSAGGAEFHESLSARFADRLLHQEPVD